MKAGASRAANQPAPQNRPPGNGQDGAAARPRPPPGPAAQPAFRSPTGLAPSRPGASVVPVRAPAATPAPPPSLAFRPAPPPPPHRRDYEEPLDPRKGWHTETRHLCLRVAFAWRECRRVFRPPPVSLQASASSKSRGASSRSGASSGRSGSSRAGRSRRGSGRSASSTRASAPASTRRSRTPGSAGSSCAVR